jgi:hypothetical protein
MYTGITHPIPNPSCDRGGHRRIARIAPNRRYVLRTIMSSDTRIRCRDCTHFCPEDDCRISVITRLRLGATSGGRRSLRTLPAHRPRR